MDKLPKYICFQVVIKDFEVVIEPVEPEEVAEDLRPVVYGYWINEPDRYFHWHCSECGYVISGPHREFHYCPKCGTKMEGDK